MATFVNIAKNSITPTSTNKDGYVLWDDPIYLWDDPVFFWDSPVYTIANIAKNATSFINITKN